MRTPLLIIFILLTLFNRDTVFAAGGIEQQQDQLTWYRADFPPVSIPGGPRADTGFFDKAMFFLIERLTSYEHHFKTANFKRIISELEKSDNICCPSLYKNKERERFIAFSVPAMVVLPNGIIVSERSREKLTPHMDEEGKISLRTLLQDDEITVGISKGRIYSGGIDPILSEFDGRKNLLARSGDDVFLGLLSMMHKGRIDCLLGYPVEAQYFARANKRYQNYSYYPIKESTVSYTIGHIGCPDNEWGRAVIKEVDEIILNHRQNEFIDFYGTWLDESTRKVHRKMALEYFDSLPR